MTTALHPAHATPARSSPDPVADLTAGPTAFVEPAMPAATVDALLAAVARDGIDAHHDGVVALAADARRRGVGVVLADVVVDRTSPEVARERALARLARTW